MGLTDASTCNEWHVLKGETQFGPYSYEDMIRLMQDNRVYGFDYTWGPHLQAWTILAELPEFSTDRLSNLAEKTTPGSVFHRRKYERVQCELTALVNDEMTMWEGRIESISEGGALIVMKNPALLPGNVINLHIRADQEGDVAFNCTAEIINKHFVKTRIQHDTGVPYAIKFINTTDAGANQIKKWIKRFKK